MRTAALFVPVHRVLLVVGICLTLANPAYAQGESVEYYATDAVGSVRVVFDASGNIVGRMDYTPFGGELSGGTNLPDQRFAGLFRDGEAGLDYAQARSYQVRTGRFNAPDPIYAGMFDPQQWNRYAYAYGNPISLTDPSGLCVPGDCDWRKWAVNMTFAILSMPPIYGQDPPERRPGTGPERGRSKPPGSQPPPGGEDPDGEDPGGQDPDRDPKEPPPTECRPGFVDAASQAWIRAGAGFSETEAGFWIVERDGTTTYPALPFTNERATITNLRVPTNARGLFHTHPNSREAKPSRPDIENSNRVKLPFYVGSNRGLWVHEPGAKTSRMLRSGLTWTNPCKK